jgi:hypothetical protein
MISIFYKTEILISPQILANAMPCARNLPLRQIGNPCFSIPANKSARESTDHPDKAEAPTALVTAQDLGKVTA